MTKIATVSYARLTPEVYQALEAKLSRTIVTSTTTPLEAGYQLGVQAVLKELRAGYVVQASDTR